MEGGYPNTKPVVEADLPVDLKFVWNPVSSYPEHPLVLNWMINFSTRVMPGRFVNSVVVNGIYVNSCVF